MDMRSSALESMGFKRRRSRDEKSLNDNSCALTSDKSRPTSRNSVISISNSKIGNNHRPSFSPRHSTSSPEIIHSPSGSSSIPTSANEICRRRSSSRSSLSSNSPVLNKSSNISSKRRNSVPSTDSITGNNCNNNIKDNGHSFPSSTFSSTSTAGAIPLTKNVGVSVNFGKGNVKSNSLSSAGTQHIIPNGHQHQQPHTPGATVVTTSSTIISNTNINNSHNNNNENNENSAAINLGHGHIGTIAGPPSVSISSGVGVVPSSSIGDGGGGVNHNSSNSSSTTPAETVAVALTTNANKGVPSSSNNQKHQPQMSPSPSSLPINHELVEPPQADSAATVNSDKSTNSSSSTAASMSGNDGNSNKNGGAGGISSRPSSPSPSTSSSSSLSSASGGSKGEKQPNTTKPGSTVASKSGSGSNSTNRIVSQNVNGTLAVTGVPSNDSELQLFRVLQRANLLNYFDLMIELGGDDVQQLCDAGEGEFLEIMSLIGMASKPLHVRRLQKALQEWMTQPSLFQTPVLPPGYPMGSNSQLPQLSTATAATASGIGQIPIPHMPTYPAAPMVPASSNPVPVPYPGAPGRLVYTPTPSEIKEISPKLTNQVKSNGIHFPNTNTNESTLGNPHTNSLVAAFALQQAAAINGEGGMLPPQLAAMLSNLSPNTNQHPHQPRQSQTHISNTKNSEKERTNSLAFSISDIKIPADQLIPSHFLETRIRTRSEASSPGSSFAGSPHPDSHNSVSPTPLSLQDHEVQKLADAAIHLIRSLPPSVAEPKFSSKRKASGDYELILRLFENDPHRMDEVRRVAAVYGRADAKRKTLKPLSMHELAINEAASQLCKHVPALLTKREELLSLSRQVIRDSGLPYSAISSTFSISLLTNGTNCVANANASSSPFTQNNNNNDINTKSKYEEINHGVNRHSSSSFTLHNGRERDASSGFSHPDGNSSFYSGFNAKRLRLDGSSAGIEIQEYNNGFSTLPLQPSPSPPTNSNGMQITELRCLPPRRSPSDDHHLPSPLELVTVTTSDLRKSGISSSGSKSSSSVSSLDSNSPPIRRPYASASFSGDDLTTSSNNAHHQQNEHHPAHGIRINHHHPHQSLNNLPPVKIASIPVNGGSISIMNHNGSNNNGNSNNDLSPHHNFSHHRLLLHQHQYNNGGMKAGMPIKSEPSII